MQQTVNKYYIAQSRFLFHCNIKIKLPLHYDESLLDECFAIMKKVDEDYNSYQKDSFFDQINNNAGNWVDVDTTTIELLNKLMTASEGTNGHYDITSMPLLKLWGFYRSDNYKVPSQNEISETLKKVDFQKIQIKGNQVKIEEGQEIITGSFIKAYAVDCVLLHLKEQGVTDALINAGGSTFATLNNTDHPEWFIRLPHPCLNDEILSRIAISSACFSMSACISNYIEIKGKKYGHIIDAQSGWPVDNLQVGVRSKSAMEADLLATALFCKPSTQLEDVIQKLAKSFQFSCYHINPNEQLYDYNFNLNTSLL